MVLRIGNFAVPRRTLILVGRRIGVTRCPFDASVGLTQLSSYGLLNITGARRVGDARIKPCF